MKLSITTDFAAAEGCPEADLKLIADAGFSHVHWCHHWASDFLYGASEIRQIERWFSDFGLVLLDLHASAGREKCPWSTREYERQAGVELVQNRLQMAAQLGSSVVILHAPGAAAGSDCWSAWFRSLEELQPEAARLGVRIALENMADIGFAAVARSLAAYGPEFLGVCYDSGHGNLFPGSLDILPQYAERLLSIHLHDNDGTGDQHRIPYQGTVDWPRLLALLAASSYRGCISQEVVMGRNATIAKEDFLAAAHAAGQQLTTELEKRCG